MKLIYDISNIKAHFYCDPFDLWSSIRFIHDRAFSLDRFVNGNVLNFASCMYLDWKQRRKLMPKATFHGVHDEKDKSTSRPPRGIES